MLELLLAEEDGFAWAALLTEGRLHDLAVDRIGEPPLYQSIWKVKIDRYLPDVGAFVALGKDRTGLFRTSSHKSGDEVVVQVKSVRSEGKADIVSEDIALTGRAFIYLPYGTSLTLSRRLDPGQVQPIRAALEELGITGGIVRSAAPGMELSEIIGEALALQARWQEILAQPAQHGMMLAPGPDASTRLRTDYSGQKVEIRRGLLEDRDLQPALAGLQSAKIDLPRGGSVIIEPATALVAIDVNAATRPPADVNREAVALIAGQLRLRNLSGLILIDFAGGQGKAWLKLLEKALSGDAAGCRIGGLTPAGLVELTRTRRDLPLAEKLKWRT
jgi:Ribonuclease G/E